MDELPGRGYSFTRCHRRDEEIRSYSKIDRVLLTKVWYNTFLVTRVELLAPGISDHCPIQVTI